MKFSQIEKLKQNTPCEHIPKMKRRRLVTTADKERSKDIGFILRLKRRWDEQYPEKNRVLKQNFGDNAARLNKELKINV